MSDDALPPVKTAELPSPPCDFPPPPPPELIRGGAAFDECVAGVSADAADGFSEVTFSVSPEGRVLKVRVPDAMPQGVAACIRESARSMEFFVFGACEVGPRNVDLLLVIGGSCCGVPGRAAPHNNRMQLTAPLGGRALNGGMVAATSRAFARRRRS